MFSIYSHLIEPEIKNLKERQQTCHSRIDNLQRKHQCYPSTHSNTQGDIWNRMRNKVNDETRKEIDFLETKKNECRVVANEYEALKGANNSDTQPAEDWRKEVCDLVEREEDLEDELLRRMRLILSISENGQIHVTCTRKDWSLHSAFLS